VFGYRKRNGEQAEAFAGFQLPGGQEPFSARSFGRLEDEPLAIYLCHEAAKQIEQHLLTTYSPKAGLLVGKAAKSSRPFVLIAGALPGTGADGAAGTVDKSSADPEGLTLPKLHKIKQEAWQEDFPGADVVGWYVNRPGEGANPAAEDDTYHERHFRLPWQVALMIDPVQNTSRFYRLENHHLVPVDSFAIWSNKREPWLHLIPEDAATGEKRKASPRNKAAIFGAVFLCAFLFFFIISKMSPPPAGLSRQADDPSGVPAMAGSGPDAGREVDGSAPPGGSTLAGDGEVSPERNSFSSGSSLGSSAGTSPAFDADTKIYIIQKGDTLWDISRHLLGDPWNYSVLAEINNIADPSYILPGRKIKLPEQQE